LTVTPLGGYTGTVNFSCGSLPSEATCTFSPSSITPNGSAATSTLTISTTAAVAALRTPPSGNQVPWIPAGSLALAGIVGFFIAPRRRIRWNRQLWILVSAILLSGAWAFIGCGGSATTGNGNPPHNPGTPSGSYTVSVSLSGSAGGPSHTLSLQVAVQ
jgi:hypothetical protein